MINALICLIAQLAIYNNFRYKCAVNRYNIRRMSNLIQLDT